MASAFAHALAAVTIGKVYSTKKLPAKFWLLGIGCSVLPDLDILAFRFGIPYSHMFGHRGFTHSFFFAAVFALIVVLIFFREKRISSRSGLGLWLYFFICTASHGILDAMTSGGKGIAFFAPFTDARHFLPWRPILVSPIEWTDFFSSWGVRVLSSESVYIGIPCFFIIFFSYSLRRLKAS